MATSSIHVLLSNVNTKIQINRFRFNENENLSETPITIVTEISSKKKFDPVKRSLI